MAPQAPQRSERPGKAVALLGQPRVWLAAVWSLFQLYTAQAGLYDLLIQLPVHVAFAVALGFLTLPIPDSPEAAERLRVLGQARWRRWVDGAAALLALACAAYYVANNGRLASRMAMVDDPPMIDVVVGVVFTVLLLEASRRHIGGALVVLALAFIAYAFVGPWLPGFLSHGGEPFLKLVDQQTLTTGGIFGIPALVSATFIYLFVVFGAVMSHGGLLRLFTDASLAVAGATRGGAGKVAVITSGLFGMVNGSAIANAVTTGAFTIPLMMRAGYRPAFAAGVESTASMGGQLIPPVMGAAAFIMAETLGVSYGTVAVAAAIPGVLYFVAVGVMVHFEAARQGLPVLPRVELPRLLPVLRRDFHLLVGPAVLVYFLVDGRSPLFAGFWALVAAVVMSQLRADTRIGLRRAFAVLVESAQSAMPVALACATVGIVVGVVSTTGLGLKLASGIVGIAQGNLFLTLLLTMVAALVLGTGLPTSATYIITSIMARLAHPVDGDDAGVVGLHHPVQLRVRPRAPARRRGCRAHRMAHGGVDARHRDARGGSDRLLRGALAPMGARPPARRLAALDLPGCDIGRARDCLRADGLRRSTRPHPIDLDGGCAAGTPQAPLVCVGDRAEARSRQWTTVLI